MAPRPQAPRKKTTQVQQQQKQPPEHPSSSSAAGCQGPRKKPPRGPLPPRVLGQDQQQQQTEAATTSPLRSPPPSTERPSSSSACQGRGPRNPRTFTLQVFPAKGPSTRDGADHRPNWGTGAVSPEYPCCGPRARPSPAPIRHRDAPGPPPQAPGPRPQTKLEEGPEESGHLTCGRPRGVGRQRVHGGGDPGPDFAGEDERPRARAESIN